MCNFSKPKGSKRSLLRYDELVTVFHELGHGIHDLVSRTTYSRFHGTRTAQDFCETPSKMLENFVPAQLQSLSRHYASGEKMPSEMTERLIRSKKVNNGFFYLRQLQVSVFDMSIHQPESHEAIKGTNTSSLYNTQWVEITGLDGPEGESSDWGHGYATFFHLLSDYGAGYYSYLLSEAHALDMFSVFRSDPLNSELGRRYRHMVLEAGGRQQEMRTLMDFLGRDPDTGAFYQELGVS